MCGEQSAGEVIWQTNVGSPPRVRGTVSEQGFCRVRHRITPACAGNRRRVAPLDGGHGDHPRVCGEQQAAGSPWGQMAGSPPRVRGTAAAMKVRYVSARITPACAGNRGVVGSFYVKAGDHPRVCGEQLACFCFCLTYKGSPPRVRGTAAHRPLPQAQGGITPACAGNRWRDLAVYKPAQDHPRVCGEQSSLPYCRIARAGSPPRVRGTVFPRSLQYS